MKLSGAGEHVWSTYLGGNDYEYGLGIAVDADGNSYATGYTKSSGWVSGGWNTAFGGLYDGYLVKLSGAGTHLWSTYLGGTSHDSGNGVAVDTGGNCYVTGETDTPGWVSGGWNTVLSGGQDGFVAKLNSAGQHLWSTYVGGTLDDYGYGVAVDTPGRCYATGCTHSPGWVSGGMDTSYNGGSWDAYATALSGAGTHLWSTYLGGTSEDRGYGIAVDSSENCYVTGITASQAWVSGGSHSTYGGGDHDAFVAKIAANGIDLPVALDNVALPWGTGGNAAWYGELTLSHDQVDAAQSGMIADSQSSELTTSATGPGTLSFWWKVSSEAEHDFLRFSIDGVLQDRISGDIWFTQRAFSLTPGVHLLKWKYSKDASGSAGADAAWLDEVAYVPEPNPSLCEALDNCALAWATAGDAAWFGQSAVSSDGHDAAQSGALADNQASELSTQVTGPGTLAFRWKVRSEADHDFLRFSVDGLLQDRISGNVYFTLRQFALGTGVHTLKWEYSKDASGSAGADAAWVDQVIWTPSGKNGDTAAAKDIQGKAPLQITGISGGGWVALGDSLTLVVNTEGGHFPLHYQWQKDGRDLSGATEDSLSLDAVDESDTGVYTASVHDAKGAEIAASAPVTVMKSLPGFSLTVLAVLSAALIIGGVALLRKRARFVKN